MNKEIIALALAIVLAVLKKKGEEGGRMKEVTENQEIILETLTNNK